MQQSERRDTTMNSSTVRALWVLVCLATVLASTWLMISGVDANTWHLPD